MFQQVRVTTSLDVDVDDDFCSVTPAGEWEGRLPVALTVCGPY